jgi:hypothetical protein
VLRYQCSGVAQIGLKQEVDDVEGFNRRKFSAARQTEERLLLWCQKRSNGAAKIHCLSGLLKGPLIQMSTDQQVTCVNQVECHAQTAHACHETAVYPLVMTNIAIENGQL